MSIYSIKNLEHLSGIKAHTIRIWEQRYDLFSPQRTETNIRFYEDSDLKLILNISLLKNNGFKISKIVQMSEEELHEEVVKLGRSSDSYEDEINALTIAMIDLDEHHFNRIFHNNIDRMGLERTITDIIYPFLKKIGILWISNSINPAQEHFISHLIRQKLIAATDGLIPQKNAPRFLLFLPENEMHELGLLFANYMFRVRGIKTLFLGQSVPMTDLEEVYHSIHPDYLFTVITSKPGPHPIDLYISELSKKFRDSTVFVTGSQVIGRKLDLPKNIQLIERFQDLDTVIHSLGISMVQA